MVLFEIHQMFKGHFLNELRVSFNSTWHKMESVMVFLLLWTYFIHFSCVSIVEYEQVIISWGKKRFIIESLEKPHRIISEMSDRSIDLTIMEKCSKISYMNCNEADEYEIEAQNNRS